MDPCTRFSKKAKIYNQYRWDYSNLAIDAIFEITRLPYRSVIADVGSGTGMLTRHFLKRVERIYAVEPNREMRQVSRKVLANDASLRTINGSAERTGLKDHNVDLIVVGRAIHWFHFEKTKIEFLRIIKPGGWLAVLQVPCIDEALLNAVRSIQVKENGWNVDADKNRLEKVPLSDYYGKAGYKTLRYPGLVYESWDEFLGRLLSISSAPDKTHERYPDLENAARRIFENYARNGRMTIRIATELHVGQMTSDQ